MLEELIIRSLADTLPSTPADALFLFGQTQDNQNAVFATAKVLLAAGKVQEVWCIAAAPMSGYPGFAKWQEEMLRCGIPVHKLQGVPVPEGTNMLHTRIEADAMAQFAMENKCRSIVVSASPFQQPRALMAAVTAVLAHYPDLKVYSYPGKPLPWNEKVTHSQGQVQGSRASLIDGEMERIRKYNTKGDLATAAVVLDYLNKRDG